MKAVSTIVDNTLGLVGFELSGSKREFGLVGNEPVTVKVTLQSVISNKITCDVFTCASGKLVVKTKNALSNLPMLLTNGGNQFVNVDNTIEVVGLVYANGELAGYDVKLGNSENKTRLRTKSLIKLTNWFKGKNFYVASRLNADGKTTYYISGRSGMSLSRLPKVDLVNAEAKTKKIKKTDRVHDMSTVDTSREQVSFIKLLNDIEFNHGMIYKPVNQTYNATSIQKDLVSDDFIPLGIGDIGNTVVNYGENKVNININFKTMGNVLVNGQQCMTYTVKSRTVFSNGKINMPELYILMPSEGLKNLLSKYAKSLAIKPVENDKVVNIYRSWFGDKTLTLAVIDISKVKVMDEAEAVSSRLNAKELASAVTDLVLHKASLRAINAQYESAKNALSSAGGSVALPKHKFYEKYDEDTLVKIKELGVNLVTGAFNGRKENKDANVAEAAKLREAIETGKVEPSDIEVSYSIKGFATVPSSKDLISGNPKAAKYVSSELNDMLEALETVGKVEDYFKLAQDYKNQLEREQSKLIRKIWMHKMSALVGSNFNSYSDGLKWESVPTRKKGAVGFASTEVEGLQLALISINMA